MFQYPDSIFSEDTELGMFGIDAKFMGNSLRFVNSAPEKYRNIDRKMIPFKNLWHIFFVVTKPVKMNQQLFWNYGVEYFTSRNIVLDDSFYHRLIEEQNNRGSGNIKEDL